ncbi:MAG: hypothetical protein E7399_02610 [Ruminococcaceae bacterium]|nr:hypothetical protein [Oscillospiraceae bacterium]
MENIITVENLRNFTYVNDTICRKPICGIVISFFGLGSTAMYSADFTEGEFYAEKGILYVVPYNNPWSWMNKQAVSLTDEIIDVVDGRGHCNLTLDMKRKFAEYTVNAINDHDVK